MAKSFLRQNGKKKFKDSAENSVRGIAIYMQQWIWGTTMAYGSSFFLIFFYNYDFRAINVMVCDRGGATLKQG